MNEKEGLKKERKNNKTINDERQEEKKEKQFFKEWSRVKIKQTNKQTQVSSLKAFQVKFQSGNQFSLLTMTFCLNKRLI